MPSENVRALRRTTTRTRATSLFATQQQQQQQQQQQHIELQFIDDGNVKTKSELEVEDDPGPGLAPAPSEIVIVTTEGLIGGATVKEESLPGPEEFEEATSEVLEAAAAEAFEAAAAAAAAAEEPSETLILGNPETGHQVVQVITTSSVNVAAAAAANADETMTSLNAESDRTDHISDDDDDDQSSGSETYEEGDLLASAMDDDVTAQLAAAGWQFKHANGPIGVAAAAAIASAKKRKRPHSFETNPSIRKRQQNRLLRKLRQTIDEFATRVGQQAIVLVATPGKPNSSYKVFGAKPLEDVVKSLKSAIMEELENALAQQAPPPVQDDPSLYELPPLIIDGIPTPVEKMTQAQLRAFIPLMLKYSTGRGKPGWGRESTRPPWWPKELPWANVRMDARSEDEKQKISWTHALRQIVINCYKFHGREDLLPAFSEEDDKSNIIMQPAAHSSSTQQSASQGSQSQQTVTQYPTVLQTITNPDGTVSLIQVDPSNPIITLPDGTTAQVQGVATIHTSQGDVQTLAEVSGADGTSVAVDLNSVTEATLGQDGQIILTGEDGHGKTVFYRLCTVAGQELLEQ